MDNGSFSFSIPQQDPRPVARYLHTRAYLKVPGIVAQDPEGEFSHLGHYCPGVYELVLPDQAVKVKVLEGSCRISWSGPESQELAQFLAHDPLWGPDWSVGQRVRQ